MASPDHAWEEGLEGIKVREKVDAEVAVYLVNGKIEEGFSIDYRSIVYKDRRGAEL